MAKGGFTGAVPPRETSPEEYSGVWDITEQYGEQKAGSWPFQADDNAPKSLRFNASDSAYLSKTPVAAGNRKTWTWSGWVKKVALSGFHPFFSAGSNTWVDIAFNSDKLRCILNAGTGEIGAISGAVFRDPSSWYHIVVAVDTTQSTAADRIKFYVNGVSVSHVAGSSGYPSQNYNTLVNSATIHRFGADGNSTIRYGSNNLADIHFIDGQALSCEEFGFFDGAGIWQPKRFTGDYSSGPVYSNFVDNQATGNIISNPSAKGPQVMFDGQLNTLTNIASGYVEIDLSSFGLVADSNGVEIYNTEAGAYTSYQINGGTAVNWGGTAGWQSFGGAGAVNTIRMNYLSGGNVNVAAAIRINGQILTDATVGRNSFHLDLSDGVKDQSGLGNDWTTNNLYGPLDAALSGVEFDGNDKLTVVNNTALGTDDFTIEFYVRPSALPANTQGGFVTTADGSDTHGFWIGHDGTNLYYVLGIGGGSWSVVQGSAGTLAVNKFAHVALTRSGSVIRSFVNGNLTTTNTTSISLTNANNSISIGGRTTASQFSQSFISNLRIVKGTALYTSSFTPPSVPLSNVTNTLLLCCQSSSSTTASTVTPGTIATSGDPVATEYIMVSDSSVDSPVNGNEASTGAGGQRRGNYCTLNPLDSPGCTLTNGNLNISCGSSKNGRGTVWPSSGKWYFEFDITTYGNPYVGIGSHGDSQHYVSKNSIAVNNTGTIYVSTNGTQTYPGYSVRLNAIGSYMCAFDLDNGKIWWGKDGTWYEATTGANNTIALSTVEAGNGAVDFSDHPNFGQEWTVQFGTSSNTSAYAFNAGQRAFKYPSSVPSGFSPLATSFLPEPTIKRGDEAMDAKLWTSTTAAQTISGYNFSPDFLWSKARSGTYAWGLWDTVRGATKLLISNGTGGEQTDSVGLTAFTSDGFTVGADGGYGTVNYQSGNTYVGFAWDAGDATTTIAAGGLNSSVYDQSQNWTSLLTSSAGTISNASNSFDGSTSTTSQLPGTSTGSYIQFGVTLNNVTKLEIYQRTNSDISGTGIQTYNNAPAAQWVELTLTSSTVSNIRLEKNTNDPGIYAIRVNNKVLVDSTATPPNVPSIATTVRANPSAGFSIVSYTGNGLTNQSVGHGLNVAPKLYIQKRRDAASDWGVTTSATGSLQFLRLNTTDSAIAASPSAPTSAVAYVSGAGTGLNYNGATYVAYCFAPVDGYSSLGSYQGNGSSDGPFVFTSMRPKFVLIRRTDDQSAWRIFDTERSSYNVVSHLLQPNDSAAELTGTYIDILSNGFKIRTTNVNYNASGGTYLYAAFAEHPFASNARAR